MVAALLQITQGVTVVPAGQAYIGVAGTAVTWANANNADVVNWTFEFIDTGSGTSAVPIGVVQSGGVATFTFTPDVPGGYLMHLTVEDSAGNTSEDYRVFQIKEGSGRIIPPFGATDSMMNFGGQSQGWAPYAAAYFREVDVVPPTLQTTQTSSVTANQVIATIPIPANSGPTDISAVIVAERNGVAEVYRASFFTSYYDIGGGPVLVGADTVSNPKTAGATSASLNSAVSGQNVVIRATPWNAGATTWKVAWQKV